MAAICWLMLTFLAYIFQGDSGGPLQCLVGDIWVFAGVSSWTYNFCEGYPSVHTRISSYLDWIKRHIT